MSQILYIFVTNLESMKTARTIQETIQSWNRGKVFFYSDFDGISGTVAVRKQLSRLCSSGAIIRCGMGIFYYPVIDTKYGFGVIPPTNGIIAKAYAEKQGIALFPTKESASNLLGLSTQNQMNEVYQTDGYSRTIDTGIGDGIRLVHTSQSRLKLFLSRDMQLLAIALNGERPDSLSAQDKAVLCKKIMNVTDSQFEHDIKLFSHEKQQFIRKCRTIIS